MTLKRAPLRWLVTAALVAVTALTAPIWAKTPAKGPAKRPAKAPAVPLPAIGQASWIWTPADNGNSGDFVCYFRKSVTLSAKPTAATVLITADNGYDLFVNGSLMGGDSGYGSEYWSSVERYDIAHLLKPGRNAVAIRGLNMGGVGGLVVAVRIDLPKAKPIQIVTDATWRMTTKEDAQFAGADYDDSKWGRPKVIGKMGCRPWGQLGFGRTVSPRRGGRRPRARTLPFVEPGEDFAYPEAIVFVGGRASDRSTPGPQAAWRIRGSRAYLEFDLFGPSMPGHSLYTLRPAKADGELKKILDAGTGLVATPRVSYDGKLIYFAMCPAGGKFYHLYSIPAEGGQPKALTSGPWHDFDPDILPDGGIVFSSTRIGSREEYHGNPGRSLFVMDLPTGQAGPGGGAGNIRPITHHIVGDNEPRVTADGGIVFIRCDNFYERAKVETQLHAIRPDGTAGRIILAADRQALRYDRANAAEQNGAWLRSFGFGSPAPLPDGRVACLSNFGLIVSGNGVVPPTVVSASAQLADVNALPDGRLLCTASNLSSLAVLDPATAELTRIYQSRVGRVHSPAHLGPRSRPPRARSMVSPQAADDPDATGFLLCQNLFYTRQTDADLARVKAVRIIQGVPFTLRSAKHPYDHVGVVGVELGTVPLAPDGSFFVEVPADRALAIQAVDAEGRTVVNELSWIYVRPGEQRSCVGCHAQREATPSNFRTVQALRPGPVKLVAQGRPNHFRANNAANGGVLNLQFDRFREVASVNLYPQQRPLSAAAARQLPPGRPTEIRRLIAALAGDDEGLRISAPQRLAIFRDRSAVGALAKALRDASGAVRMNAAMALSACGGREAVAPLTAALADAHPPAAQAAAMALSHLTGHDLPFSAYAGPAQQHSGAMAWRTWLAANDFNTIQKTLIAQLGSKEPTKVHRAVEAIGHIGDPAGAAALQKWLTTYAGKDLRAEMAAIRALGYLRDESAVDLLAGIMAANAPKKAAGRRGRSEFGTGQRPTQLVGAAAEALGRIATPRARQALVAAYQMLGEFWFYTLHNGDHSWLMGSHSSVPHYRIAEALDAMADRDTAAVVPKLLLAVPIDSDGGLLYVNDAFETVTQRVIHRSGLADRVVETCLAVLGDTHAKPAADLRKCVTASPPASSTRPLSAESRAAQLIAVVCLDPKYGPRILAALNRYRAQKPSRKRSWTCFFLARALGKLRSVGAVNSLTACLTQDPTEASFGRIPPPNVFLHDAMTPCYRAAAAYALGRIGDRRAARPLLQTLSNFDNAMDVRYAAAEALELLADRASLPQLRKLAADYPEVATRRVLLRACRAAEGRRPRGAAACGN